MKKILLAISTMVLVSTVQSQEAFSVATGDSKSGSTYSQMFRELNSRCSASMPLTEVESKGSVDNVALLTGNKVNAAIVQSDMLFFTKMTDEAKVANIRTLFSLHAEELHFIARGDAKKEGGFLGIGTKDFMFRTVEDLKGRTVGAVGGSILSGQVFAAQSKLGFTVMQYPDNATLTRSLLEGKVDTILIVAGAPSATVAGLDNRFRVLPVTPALLKLVAEGQGSVYSPAKLSYTNMAAAGVPTVATQALFVTRLYRSNEMQNQLAKLRGCFVNQLGNIQDATKTHAKWQDVNSDVKGKWTYYDLPAVK